MILVGMLIVSFSLFSLFGLSVYAYLDAPDYGMDPRKWAAIAFLVPVFGFFAYVLERDERTQDEEPDTVTEGVFEVHESRADDVGFGGGDESGSGAENDERG